MKELKKIVFCSFFLFFFSTHSMAQYLLPARAQVFVYPGRISVDVYNPYYEPITCSGQIFGETNWRQVMSSFFHHPLIPAGYSTHQFMIPYYGHFFINGWVNISCHFLRR